MANTSFFLVVNQCDNKIIATINGSIVYNKYYDGDPPLNDRVDITNNLQTSPQTNNVKIECFNGPTTLGQPAQKNPYSFNYHIEKVDNDSGGTITIASNNIYGNPVTQPVAEYLVNTFNHVIIK